MQLLQEERDVLVRRLRKSSDIMGVFSVDVGSTKEDRDSDVVLLDDIENECAAIMVIVERYRERMIERIEANKI